MTDFPKCRFPEEAGVSTKGILHFIKSAVESGASFHSLMILRHGKEVACLNFAPYDDTTPHVLFSLSKSFCSAAAGFAVQEGLLSWDSRVCDVLPECAPENPSEDLKKITLSHLLCMGSGLDPKSDDFSSGVEDWGKATLSHPVVHEPGTHFHYNSHGTYLVSRMVQKVTGMNIRDYLMPRLFEPLGIEKPTWDTCPQGVCCGGWGLKLSARDIAKFGQLLLQKGMWQGRRVLPEGWMENATAVHIDNSNGRPRAWSDWHQGYGYQFWRCCFGRFRGDGMYGQICMVDEKKDMVIACTAGMNDLQHELNLLHGLFDACDLEEGTEQEKAELEHALGCLGYAVPSGKGTRTVNGTLTYEAEQEKIELVFSQEAAGGVIRLDLQRNTLPGQKESVTLYFAQGQYLENPVTGEDAHTQGVHMMGAYGWQGNELVLTARTKDGPFTLNMRLKPSGDGWCLQNRSAGYPFGDETVYVKGAL